MPTYPILPSLTRAPAFAVQRSVEDGTIADPAESGYVSTRPRFTRLRRKFTVSYNNLIDEDLRALDEFEIETVKGKAGAFWLPNLFPNGSFEHVGPTECGIAGWHPEPSDAWDIAPSKTAGDGVVATQFSTVAGVAATGTAQTASLTSARRLKVTAGDVYQVNALVKLSNSFASATASLALSAVIAYADETTQTVSVALLSVPNADYALCSGTLTVPAAIGGDTSGTLELSFVVSIAGSGTGAAVVLLDAVGLALISATRPYGRMPGTSSPGRAVRFTKTPTIKDMPWASGHKRYGADFEVTEL